MMIEFNINDYVLVKLTDEGRTELKRQHQSLEKQIEKDLEYTPPIEDKDGWSRWQAWVLINTFGHMTGWGCKPAFETTIKIDVPEVIEG